MSGDIIKVQKSLDWVLGVEALLLSILTGTTFHGLGLHGALATVIGIFAGGMILALIIKFDFAFRIWTLLLAAGISIGAFGLIRDATNDLGWASLAGVAAALGLVGLHVASRKHINAKDHGAQILIN